MTQYAVEYSPSIHTKCGLFPLHVKVGAIIVLHSQKIKVHRYVHMDAMVFFLADAVKRRCTTDRQNNVLYVLAVLSSSHLYNWVPSHAVVRVLNTSLPRYASLAAFFKKMNQHKRRILSNGASF